MVPAGALGLGLAAVPALAPTGLAVFPAGLGGIVNSRLLGGNVDRLLCCTAILRKLSDLEKFKYPRNKNLENLVSIDYLAADKLESSLQDDSIIQVF